MASNEDEHEDEVLAQLVALDLMNDIAEAVELMLAHGLPPDPPKEQALRLKQIETVRSELREGKVRPWFTRLLTPQERLEEYLVDELRQEVVAGARDPGELRAYYEEMTRLMEREQ